MRALLAASLIVGAATGTAQADTGCASPIVSFSGLLESVSVDPVGGRLQLGKLYSLCLPTPAAGGNQHYPYHPYEGGKLTTTLIGPEGKMGTLVWYAEKIGNLWELSRYEVLGGPTALKPLAPADYRLEFAADGEPFLRFPFSVITRANEDPYATPGDRWLLRGPWEDFANLYYQRNDPEMSLQFNVWVRDATVGPQPRSVPFRLVLVRTRDGAVLGGEEGNLRLTGQWNRAQLSFHPTGNKNEFLRARELLREDGDYRIELAIDNKAYGSYRTKVQGGVLVQQPDPVRSGDDPLMKVGDTLSGGRYRSWWLRREGR